MSTLDLSVVGLGLVSPVGLSARDHAFFIRAGSTMVAPRAFVDRTGKPLGAIHCPWLDPALPPSERLVWLAERALGSALGPIRTELGEARLAAILCAPAPRAGLSESDLARVEERLGGTLSLAPRLSGAASFFAALDTAQEWLSGGDVAAVALVAVDTFACAAALEDEIGASRWERSAAYLSEAAAALVVTRPGRVAGAQEMGRLLFAATQAGEASDEDERPVDGQTMTALVRQATQHAEPGPMRCAFGPRGVDSLREQTWRYAVSRNHRAFDPLCLEVCVEDNIGRVGAAAGAVHLVYGLVGCWHGTLGQAKGAVNGGAESAWPAWAISSDGLNGLCLARGVARGVAP